MRCSMSGRRIRKFLKVPFTLFRFILGSLALVFLFERTGTLVRSSVLKLILQPHKIVVKILELDVVVTALSFKFRTKSGYK